MAYNPYLLGQTTATGSAPVVIASDQSPIPVDLISSTIATVNIGNFSEAPTSFSISNFPATQPVSGTVTANQGTSPWVVTNTTVPYGAYFPIAQSLASLASGANARLNLDQAANLMTNLATVANPVPVNVQGSVPVTGTFFQANQPVTATLATLVVGLIPGITATIGNIPAVSQSGAPWTVNASIQGQIPVVATVATLVIGLMPAVTANVVSTTTTVFQGGAPWTVLSSIQGAVPVTESGAWGVTATVVQGAAWTTRADAKYTPAAFSLASLAAGTLNPLQEDINGNLLTNLATVSAPLPVTESGAWSVTATIGNIPAVTQSGGPWTVNASIQGQVPVVATVATLVIGLMPAISVTATNTTIFQGGAPWTVNASIQGIPAVSQSGAPWTANVSVQGIPGVNATYAAPWNVVASQGAAPWLVNASVVGVQAVTASIIGPTIPQIIASQSNSPNFFGAVGVGMYAASLQSVASTATLAYYPTQIDINGNQKVVLGATTTVSIGNTSPVTQSGGPWTVTATVPNLLNALATVTQGTNPWTVNATVAGVVPVVATYAAPWNATVTVGNIPAVSQSGGPWTVTATVPNNVNTVGIPATTGGLSIFQGNLSATVATIKSTAGQIYGYHIFNNNATQVYVNIYNITTATVGLTAVAMQLGIPASGGATWDTDIGIAFTNPMIASACVSTGGVGTPTIPISTNIYYK